MLHWGAGGAHGPFPPPGSQDTCHLLLSLTWLVAFYLYYVYIMCVCVCVCVWSVYCGFTCSHVYICTYIYMHMYMYRYW
jgi:hypothetical protein